MTYNNLITAFFAGVDKTDLSVFVKISLRDGVESLQIGLARLQDYEFFKNKPEYKKYRWKETGTLNSNNAHGVVLNNWEDIFCLIDAELKTQAQILDAIFADNKEEALRIYSSLNKQKTEVIGFEIEEEDLDYIEKLIRNKLDTGLFGSIPVTVKGMDDNPETSEITKINTWLRVWTAWKHFKSVFTEMYKNKKLTEKFYKK